MRINCQRFSAKREAWSVERGAWSVASATMPQEVPMPEAHSPTGHGRLSRRQSADTKARE